MTRDELLNQIKSAAENQSENYDGSNWEALTEFVLKLVKTSEMEARIKCLEETYSEILAWVSVAKDNKEVLTRIVIDIDQQLKELKG